MEITRSIEIVHALSQGVDPFTGEILPPSSPYEKPEVIRALHTVLGHVRIPARTRLTPEEKQNTNLERGLPRNAGLPWSTEARDALADRFREGEAIEDLAAHFERSRGSIIAELRRQDLISVEEARVLQSG